VRGIDCTANRVGEDQSIAIYRKTVGLLAFRMVAESLDSFAGQGDSPTATQSLGRLEGLPTVTGDEGTVNAHHAGIHIHRTPDQPTKLTEPHTRGES